MKKLANWLLAIAFLLLMIPIVIMIIDAEFADIPETTFNRWLQHNKQPSISDACKVARVHRVTLNDLIPPEVYK